MIDLDATLITTGAGVVLAAGGVHAHWLVHIRSPVLGRAVCRLPDPSRGVALTFDDGPHPEFTPRVLDVLDAAGARGTFFLIGRHARQHPRAARLIIERGHTIANHSHTHPYSGAWRGSRFWESEITRAEEAIFDAVGLRTRWFRPPLGHRTLRQQRTLAKLGYRTIGWSRRSHDGVCEDPRAIAARATRSLRGGEIILLHDGVDPRSPKDRRATLDALDDILGRLGSRRIPVVSLEETLDKPTDP